ncbi:hypothetical protein MBCUT_16430 [Methanobrevibacter cuticularis]|uniref:Uncharacterized protein n=1 Tax=Methanobrevibacter cuticularis TaxID=47311 RepID=A0A166D476_9EURY|nr:hypothetical protein MBCUT_16430 [Methanobrevibacter cuticularis]
MILKNILRTTNKNIKTVKNIKKINESNTN